MSLEPTVLPPVTLDVLWFSRDALVYGGRVMHVRDPNGVNLGALTRTGLKPWISDWRLSHYLRIPEHTEFSYATEKTKGIICNSAEILTPPA